MYNYMILCFNNKEMFVLKMVKNESAGS